MIELPAEVLKMVTDQVAAAKGIDASVKSFLAALEIERQKDRAQSADGSGPCADLQAYTQPCKLLSIVCYNGGLAQIFIQAHNKGSAAAEAVAPRLCLPVPSVGFGTFDFRPGIRFSQGIYLCGSSTDLTKTLILTNTLLLFCSFQYD